MRLRREEKQAHSESMPEWRDDGDPILTESNISFTGGGILTFASVSAAVLRSLRVQDRRQPPVSEARFLGTSFEKFTLSLVEFWI
jgi:hypothetical protein